MFQKSTNNKNCSNKSYSLVKYDNIKIKASEINHKKCTNSYLKDYGSKNELTKIIYGDIYNQKVPNKIATNCLSENPRAGISYINCNKGLKNVIYKDFSSLLEEILKLKNIQNANSDKIVILSDKVFKLESTIRSSSKIGDERTDGSLMQKLNCEISNDLSKKEINSVLLSNSIKKENTQIVSCNI